MEEIPPELDAASQWYLYRCSSCRYETKIEDIVFDAYFFSQGCERGERPTFTCPKCHDRMRYVGEVKSAPKVR